MRRHGECGVEAVATSVHDYWPCNGLQSAVIIPVLGRVKHGTGGPLSNPNGARAQAGKEDQPGCVNKSDLQFGGYPLR